MSAFHLQKSQVRRPSVPEDRALVLHFPPEVSPDGYPGTRKACLVFENAQERDFALSIVQKMINYYEERLVLGDAFDLPEMRKTENLEDTEETPVQFLEIDDSGELVVPVEDES